MDYYKKSLELHERHCGKWAVTSKVPLKSREDLSVAYTPGVAQPCLEIRDNPNKAYRYTAKGNTVAIVTDGTSVLGLGDIGAEAAIPVMEGKAVLFKAFAGIDALPICLQTRDVDEIVSIVKAISPTLGGVNLEDISAPRCFEVERKLQACLDIPVFHDDQHGTAVVTSAAVINALRVTGKEAKTLKVVINGAGAAGAAILKMLRNLGIADILVCDSKGIISEARAPQLTAEKKEILAMTNAAGLRGGLAEAVCGRDVFIGVSRAGVLSEEMAASMAKDAVIFAMANPEPEIHPSLAKDAGARIVGTGRSDYPNQINNVLIFPGIFRGALDARAKRITEKMKVAAAYALADFVTNEELCEEKILPGALEKGVADAVASAVANAWNTNQE